MSALTEVSEADELKAIVDKYLSTPVADKRPVVADARMVELVKVAERVARTDVTVTINGPSGCGKEVFARYIHDQSPRGPRQYEGCRATVRRAPFPTEF